MQMDAGPRHRRHAAGRAHGRSRADDTTATLHDRLAALGGRLIVEALELAACGGLSRTPQPAEGVTYAHKIDKAEAAIDWTQPAEVIERRVRAFDPFPGASLRSAARPSSCGARALCADARGAPGTVLRRRRRPASSWPAARARCALTELQRPGGKRAAGARSSCRPPAARHGAGRSPAALNSPAPAASERQRPLPKVDRPCSTC